MTARGSVYNAACRVVDQRSHGMCEAPLVWQDRFGCEGQAVVHHHLLRRRSDVDDAPDNLAHLCLACHRAVHDNTGIAYEHGLLRRSGRPSKVTRTISQGGSQVVSPDLGDPR
jgi:hypothetical protein